MATPLHIKASATTVFLLLAILLFILPQAIGQPAISISKVSACAGSEVVVPVVASGFKDVAAITLFIRFDTTAVSYVDIGDFNQALSGGSVVNSVQYTQNPSSINISWASMAPATINKETLFNIRFLLKSDSAALHFSPDCEIALSNLSVVGDMLYNDGTISPFGTLTPEPKLARIDEGSTAHFVLPLLTGAAYQWQQNAGAAWVDCSNSDLFEGVKTQELLVKSVKPELNNSSYRCLIYYTNCTEATYESMLQVSAVGMDEQAVEQNNLLVVNPNPVGDVITFGVGASIENANVRLMDSQGKTLIKAQVAQLVPGAKHSMKIGHLPSGMYFLQLFDGKRLVASVRLIHKL